jgi:hypothetical protein
VSTQLTRWRTAGSLSAASVQASISASHTPLFSAARYLIDHGLDPSTELVLQYEGTDTIAFRMTAGATAGLLAVQSDRSRFTVVPSTPPAADSPALPSGAAQDGPSALAQRGRAVAGSTDRPQGGVDPPRRPLVRQQRQRRGGEERAARKKSVRLT